MNVAVKTFFTLSYFEVYIFDILMFWSIPFVQCSLCSAGGCSQTPGVLAVATLPHFHTPTLPESWPPACACFTLPLKSTTLRSKRHCTAPYCIEMNCDEINFTSLHCTIFYCTALYSTALHCIWLHCSVFDFVPLIQLSPIERWSVAGSREQGEPSACTHENSDEISSPEKKQIVGGGDRIILLP